MSLNIAQIKRLLEQIGIGTEFIFNPNLPEPNRNVFNNWESLINQQQQLDLLGIPTTIFFDKSVTSFNVPDIGVTYSFGSTTFQGVLIPNIIWGSNTSFSSFPVINQNITHTFNNNSNPVMDMQPGDTFITQLRDASLVNNGTIEVVRANDASNLSIVQALTGNSNAVNGFSFEFFNMADPGAVMQIQGSAGLNIFPGTIRGDGTITFISFDRLSTIGAQLNFIGTLTSLKENGGAILLSRTDEISGIISGTNQIPYDNTVPQDNEGFELFNSIIIPGTFSTQNIITEIDSQIFLSPSVNSVVTLAAFDDQSTNAIAVSTKFIAANTLEPVRLYKAGVLAGQADDRTYSIRAGMAVPGTLTMNGDPTAKYGNAMESVVTVKRNLIS